jgi:ketosteroid isomerase-like protein
MNRQQVIAQIEKQDLARCTAMLAKDTTALAGMLDDQLVYVHSSGVADTKQSYLEGLRMGVWNYHQLAASGQRYVIHGNTVLVFCRLAISITVRGVFKSFETNALLVWVRHPERWRLAAVQSSSIAEAA